MSDLQWLGVDLFTGAIVADLPDVELTEPLGATIGQYESTTMVLHLGASTNPDWLEATQPGGAALIAWTGDPASPVITWGGIVQQRIRELGTSVQLAAVTPEAYLDACYVGDYETVDTNQDTILESLMAFAAGDSRVPVNLNLLTASTKTQSVAYTRSSQTTVYAALQALSGVHDGPEWFMDWVWDLDARTILPRTNYGARVGSPVLAGHAPNVTFDLSDLQPGSRFTEDYSPGHGANDITTYGAASSTATTSDIPSAQVTALDLKGRPLWSYAYQPNQTVSDTAVLATYAEAALTQMQDGAQPLSMRVSNTLVGKRFGVDWSLGDDIGWHLDGPAFPIPAEGVARCIGYSADSTTVTPILKGASLG